MLNIGDKFVVIDKVTDHRSKYVGKVFTVSTVYPDGCFGKLHYGVTDPDCIYIFYDDEVMPLHKSVLTSTIKDVIFNPPATIIIWNDRTKSVVKCQNGEPFDAEKGFALAYLKKLLGNDNTFNKEIAKWVKEPKKHNLSVREMNDAIKDHCDTVSCRECKLFTDIPYYNACYDTDSKEIKRNYKILFGEDK